MAGEPLIVTLDISELINDHQDLAEQLTKRANESAEKLAAMTHAHIIESAHEKLHTRREDFIQSLKLEQLDGGIWAITIPKESLWIEEGINSGFDMLPGFLSSPKAKSGKNGKYLIIPFKHNKAPSKQTPVQVALAAAIKTEMERRNISSTAIERHPDGSPKTGLVHKFNIKEPQTTAGAYRLVPQVHQKPWMARPPSKEAQKPLLWGVRIYQRSTTDGQGREQIKKDVMTFRTASESQTGKWIHPGLQPMKFLDEAKDWAQKQWEEVIFPEILSELGLT